MYSLLVSADEQAWKGDGYTYHISRFLEYTDDSLIEAFKNLDEDAIRILTSYPVLFVIEDHSNEPARVGWLKSIQRRGNDLRLRWQFEPEILPLTREQLESLAWDLQISGGEFSRTHWSVKDVNIFPVVHERGLLPESLFADPRTFKIPRGLLLQAADVLAERLSHAKFDHLLLELDLDAAGAGRNIGGLKARANALATYVIDRPFDSTATGEVLGAAVLRRAAIEDLKTAPLDDFPQSAFWADFVEAGFSLEGSALVFPTNSSPTAVAEVPDPQPVLGRVPARPIEQVNIGHVTAKGKPKVFVVHGRDHGTKETVARFLENGGAVAVILHERENRGRTLIAKFREESADIEFAVVLITADDEGRLKGDEAALLEPRARQNVVFELGFFIEMLGPSKVCAIVKGALFVGHWVMHHTARHDMYTARCVRNRSAAGRSFQVCE